MQTIRQAFILLRQNPLLSTIFILGTAFAITMIMAIVITWQMKYADIEPEVNRNRSLYISKMHLQGKENKGWNNYTACSPAFMKDCVQPLPEVEACTAFVPATVALVSMPDGTNAVKVDAMETDPGFWKVFRMQFVAGRGFDDSDRGGDVSAIVVAASVARKLFGTTDAVGKTVLLNRNEARICGVVKDVSVIAKDAYAQVWRMYPAKLQDTIGCAVRIINATGGYTRVFRMKEDAGRPFAAMPVGNDVTSGNYVMLSEGTADYYKERVPGFSLDTPLSWYGDTANVVTQCGMIGSFRSYRYGADAKWAFRRIDENVIRTELQDYEAQIVFRVKENMDSSDYRSKFLKEIAPHLDTDNMFIADVAPYTEQQYQFEVMKGDVDKVNTQTVVVVFLLVNVFLGLIGTFWFRTRRRRNEIALRLAMGSTKKQIFCLLMGEGLLLLTLVALPAMIVCYNVGIAEFTMGHTELITTWPVEWSFLRFLLGSLGAWLLIALMVVIGIWFPARQAIKIQPAEALHEE